jgi:hypothetical protein
MVLCDNCRLPQRYISPLGEITWTSWPEDCQPSGHINFSKAKEFYVNENGSIMFIEYEQPQNQCWRCKTIIEDRNYKDRDEIQNLPEKRKNETPIDKNSKKIKKNLNVKRE